METGIDEERDEDDRSNDGEWTTRRDMTLEMETQFRQKRFIILKKQQEDARKFCIKM